MKIPWLLYNLLGFRVKIPLKFTYIAKLLVLATPVSICSYNGVVENDDLLSLFTANRKLPMATDIRSEFSDCQWYQWQPMAANGTNGKIINGTIGKTPNARMHWLIVRVHHPFVVHNAQFLIANTEMSQNKISQKTLLLGCIRNFYRTLKSTHSLFQCKPATEAPYVIQCRLPCHLQSFEQRNTCHFFLFPSNDAFGRETR